MNVREYTKRMLTKLTNDKNVMYRINSNKKICFAVNVNTGKSFIAKCNGLDEFNEQYGLVIAYCRYLGFNPEKYINAIEMETKGFNFDNVIFEGIPLKEKRPNRVRVDVKEYKKIIVKTIDLGLLSYKEKRDFLKWYVENGENVFPYVENIIYNRSYYEDIRK